MVETSGFARMADGVHLEMAGVIELGRCFAARLAEPAHPLWSYDGEQRTSEV